MNRLTTLGVNGIYGLVKVKNDEQEVESPYPNTLRAIVESFQRLGEYENTKLMPTEIIALKAENQRLKEQADSAYMDGVRYAIYEIMKEADVYGSQTIRDSGDTADGMCEQAVRLITADLNAYRKAEQEGRLVEVQYSPGEVICSNGEGHDIIFTGRICYEVQCNEDYNLMNKSEIKDMILFSQPEESARTELKEK